MGDLAGAGLRTLRFFGAPHQELWTDPVKREKIFYPAMDIIFDLCERHHLSAFFSLGCDIFVQQDAGENLREPVGDANSKSRQALMEYLEEFIPRYKHRKAIGMWEITSELTLQGILCRDGGIFCRNMTIWHE